MFLSVAVFVMLRKMRLVVKLIFRHSLPSSAELALAWFGQLDSLEAASMNILAHGPVVSKQSLPTSFPAWNIPPCNIVVPL